MHHIWNEEDRPDEVQDRPHDIDEKIDHISHVPKILPQEVDPFSQVSQQEAGRTDGVEPPAHDGGDIALETREETDRPEEEAPACDEDVDPMP